MSGVQGFLNAKVSGIYDLDLLCFLLPWMYQADFVYSLKGTNWFLFFTLIH